MAISECTCKEKSLRRSKMQLHIHANMKNADNFDDLFGGLSEEDIMLDTKGFIIPLSNRVDWFGLRSAVRNGLEATE